MKKGFQDIAAYERALKTLATPVARSAFYLAAEDGNTDISLYGIEKVRRFGPSKDKLIERASEFVMAHFKDLRDEQLVRYVDALKSASLQAITAVIPYADIPASDMRYMTSRAVAKALTELVFKAGPKHAVTPKVFETLLALTETVAQMPNSGTAETITSSMVINSDHLDAIENLLAHTREASVLFIETAHDMAKRGELKMAAGFVPLQTQVVVNLNNDVFKFSEKELPFFLTLKAKLDDLSTHFKVHSAAKYVQGKIGGLIAATSSDDSFRNMAALDITFQLAPHLQDPLRAHFRDVMDSCTNTKSVPILEKEQGLKRFGHQISSIRSQLDGL